MALGHNEEQKNSTAHVHLLLMLETVITREHFMKCGNLEECQMMVRGKCKKAETTQLLIACETEGTLSMLWELRGWLFRKQFSLPGGMDIGELRVIWKFGVS